MRKECDGLWKVRQTLVLVMPKVKGALTLEKLLRDTPLDFFVSFSSIASVAPGPGQTVYGAANAVLAVVTDRPM